jgi:hypothetical protein
MRNRNALLVVFLALLVVSSMLRAAGKPQTGEHVDITLSDGRVFKNAEVIKSDERSLTFWDGKTLVSVKLYEIRTYSPKNSPDKVTPAPSAPPKPAAETNPKPVQPPAGAPQIPPLESITQPAVAAHMNPVPVALLGAGLIAAIVYALWQRRKARKTYVEGKKQEAFANELKAKLASLEARYGGLVDLDAAARERKNLIETENTQLRLRKAEKDQVTAELIAVRKELSLFDDERSIIACGHYKPSYDFNTSDAYKHAIEAVRDKQRAMLKDEQAAHCSKQWLVNGSEAEGRKATKRTLRLMLRAFNGESDAIVANVTWNNVDRMVDRLRSAFDAINNLGESYQCSLSYDYLKLKDQELRLAIEYATKLKKEKDEQRALKEQMRDEERARREMEEALKQTALDEERAKKALEQARTELAAASGAKEASLNEKIRLLEGRLTEALQNKERAISRAQQTRSGHVYIISNIGSFGESVFKIGMTRRLDPMDRVQELGDASVPFSFDVHAMIYTDDAPTLESKLHERFDQKRLNLVNERKEFFNATIEELEVAVREMGARIELTRLAEAREYRETLERKKTLYAAS